MTRNLDPLVDAFEASILINDTGVLRVAIWCRENLEHAARFYVRNANTEWLVGSYHIAGERLITGNTSTIGVSVGDTLIGRFADAGEAALWKLRWEGQIPHWAGLMP